MPPKQQPEHRVVPFLAGLSYHDAAAALRFSGLVAARSTRSTHDPDDVGRVVDESPAAGRTVELGARVRLVVGTRVVEPSPTSAPADTGPTVLASPTPEGPIAPG